MSSDSRNGQGGEGATSSPPLTLHRPDLYVAFVVLAICGFLFANTYWFSRVPASLAQNVQPAMFPRLVLTVIIVFTLLLPFEYGRKIRQGVDLDSDRRDQVRGIVFVTGVALIGLVAAMPIFGALPALVLITAVLPVMWGERRWKYLIPYVILFPLAVLYLFSEILQVSFPRGIGNISLFN